MINEHVVMKTRRSHILDHFFHQHIQIDTSKTQYVLDEPAHRTSIVLVPFVARKQNCDVSKMIGNLGPIGERAVQKMIYIRQRGGVAVLDAVSSSNMQKGQGLRFRAFLMDLS